MWYDIDSIFLLYWALERTIFMKTMINNDPTIKNTMVIDYYNGDCLCSKIYVDTKNKEVQVRNFTSDNIERAFGVNQNPTWTDFENFLENRCFPRDRQNLKLELKKLGLNEYNPLDICKATSGRNYKDEQWMDFSKEEEFYENYE